jgi:hypothetical protein
MDDAAHHSDYLPWKNFLCVNQYQLCLTLSCRSKEFDKYQHLTEVIELLAEDPGYL